MSPKVTNDWHHVSPGLALGSGGVSATATIAQFFGAILWVVLMYV